MGSILAAAEPDGETLTVVRSGEVYLLRHALAPGSGDPPGMDLNDPATQRNLSEAGREQARAIGERLRAEGITDPVVYSSQWARCRETATLLGFGEPIVTAGLNSFWEAGYTKEAVMTEFRELVNALPDEGPPVIMVTHFVNIRAIAGQSASSGDGFWRPLVSLRD